MFIALFDKKKLQLNNIIGDKTSRVSFYFLSDEIPAQKGKLTFLFSEFNRWYLEVHSIQLLVRKVHIHAPD
jgi:hypothetical protein